MRPTTISILELRALYGFILWESRAAAAQGSFRMTEDPRSSGRLIDGPCHASRLEKGSHQKITKSLKQGQSVQNGTDRHGRNAAGGNIELLQTVVLAS